MAELDTNFVDAVLSANMNGKKRVRLTQIAENEYIVEDITEYEKVGSEYGQKEINTLNETVNGKVNKVEVIDDLDTVKAVTEDNVPVGCKAVTKFANDVNQSLTDIGECVILGQTSSTSESNQIELPDDINNYKLLILMYLSTDGDILNTNIVPIKYFKQTKYRVIAIWTNTSLGAFAKYIDDTHINLYVRTRYSAVLIGVK